MCHLLTLHKTLPAAATGLHACEWQSPQNIHKLYLTSGGKWTQMDKKYKQLLKERTVPMSTTTTCMCHYHAHQSFKTGTILLLGKGASKWLGTVLFLKGQSNIYINKTFCSSFNCFYVCYRWAEERLRSFETLYCTLHTTTQTTSWCYVDCNPCTQCCTYIHAMSCCYCWLYLSCTPHYLLKVFFFFNFSLAHTISCCLHSCRVSYSLLQGLDNSCTRELHQPNSYKLPLDLVTVSKEWEIHNPNSRQNWASFTQF